MNLLPFHWNQSGGGLIALNQNSWFGSRPGQPSIPSLSGIGDLESYSYEQSNTLTCSSAGHPLQAIVWVKYAFKSPSPYPAELECAAHHDRRSINAGFLARNIMARVVYLCFSFHGPIHPIFNESNVNSELLKTKRAFTAVTRFKCV